MLRIIISSLTLLLLTGCASTLLPPLTAVQGVEIETLQSSVNVSLVAAAGKTAGHGVLFYRKPDRFRLSILTPFGQTMLDLLVEGEKVTCLLPAKNQAWQGTFDDLPANLGMGVWPLMKWVVEPPPPPGPALVRFFDRPDGTAEKVFYDESGFVLRKLNSFGDEVAYADYHVVDGVAFPWQIEVTTRDGSRLKLVFDEPDINRPLDEEVLRPSLAGFEVLPLAGFRGF